MGAKILFISNGHGEDTVGAAIAKATLQRDPDIDIKAFPIVGKGQPYTKAGINVISPVMEMPSGGFLYQGLLFMIRDVASGLVGLTFRQLRVLHSLRGEFDIVVGVGDNVPLFFNSLAMKLPMVFMGIARSARYKGGGSPYSSLECRVMRRYCNRIFVRDEETALALHRQNVDAVYLGNPMMDCLTINDVSDLHRTPNMIGVLPGSRDEAYTHITFLLKTISQMNVVRDGEMTFAFAIAESLDMDRIEDITEKSLADIMHRRSTIENPGGYRIVTYDIDQKPTVMFAKGLFGDILSYSRVVIGLSGTGNEQAAGLGCPVITFWGDGPQITERFIRSQKKLLGDALYIVRREPEEIINALKQLLADDKLRKAMSDAGRKAIEGFGSTGRIADEIISVLPRK